MEHLVDLIQRLADFYYPFFAYDIKVFEFLITSWWNWVLLGIPTIGYIIFFLTKWAILWIPITLPIGSIKFFNINKKKEK